jgi:hypothetical protein
MKKLFAVLLISLLFVGCATTSNVEYGPVDEEKIMEVVNEVGMMFRYYLELDPKTKNLIVGQNEVGGQCGDYAIAFVNIWNKKYPKQEALLVIQQQGIKQFPDGIYKVGKKDNRNLPFLKNMEKSNIYYTDDGNFLGFYHPILDNYQVRLVKREKVTSHFGNPVVKHVWVKIGNVIVDPTFADTMGSPIIGKNIW